MLDRRQCLRVLGFALPAASVLGGPSFPTTVADRVDRRYETPFPRPMGIKATREGIWFVDGETTLAYLMSFSGTIKAEIETGTERPTAIDSDEVGIWVAGDKGRQMIRIEFIDEEGETDYEIAEVKRQFEAPGSGPARYGAPGEYMAEAGVQGISWIRGELYLAVPAAATIFVVKAQDGTVSREIESPGVRPQGLVFTPDGALWCADANSRSFFKLDPASGKVLKQHMLPFAAPEVNGKVIVPHGLTYWQRMLYFCSPETSEVYRTPLINRMS